MHCLKAAHVSSAASSALMQRCVPAPLACRLIVYSDPSFRNLKFQSVARNFELHQPASHSRRHSQTAANDSQRVARAQGELLNLIKADYGQVCLAPEQESAPFHTFDAVLVGPVWLQELEEKAEEIRQLKQTVKEQELQIIKLGVKVEELEGQRESLVKGRDNAFENGFGRGFAQGAGCK